MLEHVKVSPTFRDSVAIRLRSWRCNLKRSPRRIYILLFVNFLFVQTAFSQRYGAALNLNEIQDYATTVGNSSLDTLDSMTFECWFKPTMSRWNNQYQILFSKRKNEATNSFTNPGSWQFQDVTNADGRNGIKGFVGAVFDGRYIYFSPWWKGPTSGTYPHSGRVLRYDTDQKYDDASAWEVYDAESEDGYEIAGLEGAVYDGRYVYFVPLHHGGVYYGKILRYDTNGPFSDEGSWDVYNAENENGLNDVKGFTGAVYDGEYVYFVPNGFGPHGNVLRLDTKLNFQDSNSWDIKNVSNIVPEGFFGGIFDGRYVYMCSHQGAVLRYDTHLDFFDSSSWLLYSGASQNVHSIYGATFDGRYIYFSPSSEVALRYDTKGEFLDSTAWHSFRVTNVDTTMRGFVGPVYDGRYVYYPPMYDRYGGRLGTVLRFDTRIEDFSQVTAWSTYDLTVYDSRLRGFEGAIYDGRYVYFMPMNFEQGHGIIPRFDTEVEQSGGYSFVLSHSSSSFGGGPMTPLFRLSTIDGMRSVILPLRVDSLLQSWHHIAVTYDGLNLALYLDGLPAAARTYQDYRAAVINSANFQIGTEELGTSYFAGLVDEFRVWRTVRTESEIREGMASGIPLGNPAITAYWAFDREADSVLDRSGNGNVLLLKNGASIQRLENYLPVFVSIPDTQAVEDSAYVYRSVAHDADSVNFGDYVRYRLIDSPTWLSIDSTTGLVYGVPLMHNLPDTVVTIEVYDNMGGSSTQTYKLLIQHVNHSPEVISSPDTVAAEDQVYDYLVAATDQDAELFGDIIRFRLVDPPSWITIDSISGVVSGTPVWVNARDTIMCIEAYDNRGGVATQRFRLKVNHVNHPPAITNLPDSVAWEDSILIYRVVAADKDTVFGDILRYKTSVSPYWLAIDSSSGILEGVPEAFDVGDTTVTVVVEDGVGGAVQQSFNLKVFHTNHAPGFISSPGLLALEDSLYTHTLVASDVDTLFADTLHYSIVEGPSWLSVDGSDGMMSGVPGAFDVGEKAIVVRVDDGKGGFDQQAYTLSVVHINHSPTISGSPDSIAYEDAEYHYRVTAADVDTLFGDLLTYSLPVRPSWLSIDSSSGTISGTPRGINVGDTLLAVLVHDGAGGSVVRQAPLRIQHVNHPPTFVSVPDTVAFEDSPYSYKVRATDTDSLLFGDRVSYRVAAMPSWLRFDSSSRSITGVPAATNVNDTLLVIMARDDSGAIVEQRFPLRVKHVNHSPKIVSLPVDSVAGGSLYWYRVTATDQDTLFGDILRYSIGKGHEWLKIESTKGLLSGVVPASSHNDVPVIIHVSDQAGEVTEQSFEIRILPEMVEDVQWVIPVDEHTIELKIPREPIRFVWPPLFRSGTLTRELRIQGPAFDSLVSGIQDTTTTLPIMDRLQPNSTYKWTIRAVRAEDGTVRVDSFYFRTSAIKFGNSLLSSSIPEKFLLEQNFPNPFNPSTTIVYGLPEDADVRLEIFDMLGQLVYRKDERQRPGYYDVQWQGIDLSGRRASSGVYIYRLVASGANSPNSLFVQTRKMILLK